jgi:hypothetical protein
MKPKWIMWFDAVIALIIGGLFVLTFALPEIYFRYGWIKGHPPKGQFYVICKAWNIDRHMFNNITTSFKFPGESPSSYSFTQLHLAGRRGIIQRVKLDEGKSDQEFSELLRQFLDEYAVYYLSDYPDGKPPIRMDPYIISHEGKIFHLPPLQTENGGE